MVQTKYMKRCRSMPYIPDDLHPQILVHLPVKSLVRFRCVSKSWQSLIVDPDFARSHLSHQNASNNVNNDQTMVLQGDSVVRYNKDFEVEAMLGILRTNKLPIHNFKSLLGSHHHGYTRWEVTDYIDGLFLLKSYKEKLMLMLWNPSIRKARVLPPKPPTLKNGYDVEIGLGFDPSIKDYKYVTVVVTQYSNVHSFLVYTFGTNSWKQNLVSKGCPKAIPGMYIGSPISVCCFGGVMYFIAKRSITPNVVASYNLKSEEFSHGNLPKIEDSNYNYRNYCQSLKLAHDGSSLALVYLCGYCSKGWIYSGQVGLRADHITWIKVHTFGSATANWDICRRFVYFKNEDEILLVLKSDKDAVKWVGSFNIKTEKEKVLVNISLGMFDAYPYVESLMLVNG